MTRVGHCLVQLRWICIEFYIIEIRNLPMVVSSIDWSLYAIIDIEALGDKRLDGTAEDLIRGGAGILQYRDKISSGRTFFDNAKVLRRVTKGNRIPLIINDRVDIALAVDADGVHVGPDDLPVETVRKILGKNRLVGFSLHRTIDLDAAGGADYIGLGAIFDTLTKDACPAHGLTWIGEIRKKTSVPLIGIGGINAGNSSDVIRAGCDGVASVSALLGGQNPKGAARQIIEAVRRAKNIPRF
jgi:thiamine-phosphate pyrophosphorylase